MSKSPPSRLLVLLPPARHGGRDAPDSGLRVRTLAIAGTRVDAGEASLAELPRGVRLELVFDAADVHLATLEAPRLSDARLRLALPSLLEDRLLGDPADSHLAYASEREADGRLRVAAVDRGWLTRVLDACAAANLTPRSAWSALHLLPVPADGTLGLRVSAGHGLLRTGTTDGLSFDLAGDAALLGLALAQAQARCVRVYGDPLAAAALPWPEAVQVQDAHARPPLACAWRRSPAAGSPGGSTRAPRPTGRPARPGARGTCCRCQPTGRWARGSVPATACCAPAPPTG